VIIIYIKITNIVGVIRDTAYIVIGNLYLNYLD